MVESLAEAAVQFGKNDVLQPVNSEESRHSLVCANLRNPTHIARNSGVNPQGILQLYT
jgi:hypothetical protein